MRRSFNRIIAPLNAQRGFSLSERVHQQPDGLESSCGGHSAAAAVSAEALHREKSERSCDNPRSHALHAAFCSSCQSYQLLLKDSAFIFAGKEDCIRVFRMEKPSKNFFGIQFFCFSAANAHYYYEQTAVYCIMCIARLKTCCLDVCKTNKMQFSEEKLAKSA